MAKNNEMVNDIPADSKDHSSVTNIWSRLKSRNTFHSIYKQQFLEC